MRELSVPEQRYEAVRSVIAEGETVTEVAARVGVARKTLHVWLGRYEAGGLDALGDRTHRPKSCPHQMPAVVEVALAEMRRGIRAGVRDDWRSSWPGRGWIRRRVSRRLIGRWCGWD